MTRRVRVDPPKLDAVIPPSRPSRPLLGVLIVALLAGCAPEVVAAPVVTLSDHPKEIREVVPSPPEDPMPEVAWPLTGLSAEGVGTEVLERPAIGVKVENGTEARPQAGLEHADIVFEEYINDRSTRFLAVYHTYYPEEVGPVRSARSMDPNIFGSFHSALVSSGANFGVQNIFQWDHQYLFMEDARYQNITKGYIWYCDGFYRVSPTASMHSVRIDVASMAECALEKGASPAGPQFDYAYPAEAATAVLEGDPVSTVDIRFSYKAHPHWVWDEADGRWRRFEFGDPHLTQDGNPITAANVIVLRVKVVYTQPRIPESMIIRTGDPGFVATGGKVIPIAWSKSDRTGKFILTTLDGDPVLLAPGTTWIELAPRVGGADTATITFDGVVQP